MREAHGPECTQLPASADAAAAAPEGAARREAAIAALPGRRSKRGAMRVYYGQGGAAGTRVGQKFKLRLGAARENFEAAQLDE